MLGRAGGDLWLGVAGRVLQHAGYELPPAHPLRTKAIASARVKTDAVDTKTLAHLLRSDLLRDAYIAPREMRELRDRLRNQRSTKLKPTNTGNSAPKPAHMPINCRLRTIC
ncbi:MAG: hypothetical protein JO342_03695 [Solirubrobacterales bacterium]|nr:hypothetical protein [Solirubrobacterales bacterium]